jgi:phospholipase C
VTITDYSSHHEPFMYYSQTRNPHRLRPTSVAMIGKTDQANHQYDTTDFSAALKTGNLPAVSCLKAPSFQDGHPGNSDPLSEQSFLVQVVNALQQSPEWAETAVFINYDASDGWYDHVLGPIVTPSAASLDFVAGPGNCGTPAQGRVRGSLRLWTAAAPGPDLALVEAQLRGPYDDRPELEPPLRRGQLAARIHRRSEHAAAGPGIL